MTEAQRAAIAAIESQQPQKHNTVWMAGEQLKEIARSEPGSAELLAKDLAGKGMTIADAETKIAELGSSLSGGERQRLGIARAFLHDADILFLDEPTSNIDSLNEGMILRSLKEECADKTILMVSHRKSTMGIADDVLEM